MGSTIGKLKICPCCKKKNKEKNGNGAMPPVPVDTEHMYDDVSNIPTYAIVNKSQTKNTVPEDSVQYAELGFFPPKPSGQQQVNQTPATEYATIQSITHPKPCKPSKPPKRYDPKDGTLV